MSESDDDTRADGGSVEQEIFGTGDSGRGPRTSSPQERFRRLMDLYVLSPLRTAWDDWRARIGGIGLLFYILMGTVGVMIVPKPVLNEGPRYLPALVDPQYPLGTNNVGVDLLKKVVHSTPAMLKMALAGVLFTVGAAVIVGFVAGYKGGTIDAVLMTFTDIMLTLPALPLVILIAAIYPPEDPFIVGAILSINRWTGLARQIRSQVLTLREEAYVEASRAMGISTTQIIGRDLFPRMAPFIMISSAFAANGVIIGSTALYFLGILPFSTSNWGVMLNYARRVGGAIQHFSYSGHWLLVPLLAITGMTFSLVLFGQGMDRVFNPRLRARHSTTTPDTEEDRP
ncbi:MAG: ABC transporter permease [Haloarculaceae archaeon]